MNDKSADTAGVETLWGEKRLTAAQRKRLQRLCRAAGELAAEGGYAAVTMRGVAERAGVGLATVYRYFASKDHLIAEVTKLRSRSIIVSLRAYPPLGGTAQERLITVFDAMLEATAEDLPLAAAGAAALSSPTAVLPGDTDRLWLTDIMVAYFDAALGDEDVGDRLELADLLGHLFFAVMIGLTTGRSDLAAARSRMAAGVRRLLPSQPG